MAMQVLIVEDDPDFAESVAANLEAAGYRLFGSVRSGIEAFRLCESSLPDIALVDIGLDGQLDGVFLGEQLAERGIKVIYLTGRVARAVLEGRQHAAAVLAKPCSYGELKKALDGAAQDGSQAP